MCTGTPGTPGTHDAHLLYVADAAEQLAARRTWQPVTVMVLSQSIQHSGLDRGQGQTHEHRAAADLEDEQQWWREYAVALQRAQLLSRLLRSRLLRKRRADSQTWGAIKGTLFECVFGRQCTCHCQPSARIRPCRRTAVQCSGRALCLRDLFSPKSVVSSREGWLCFGACSLFWYAAADA